VKFLAVTQPGIQAITSDEIRHKWKDSEVNKSISIRNGALTSFSVRTSPAELLTLRTTEDVYAALGEVGLSWQKNDLEGLYAHIVASKELEPALAIHRQLHRRAGMKTTYRVVVQTDRDPRPYRRVDLQKALEKAIGDRYHHKWKLVDEEADLEFWGMLSGRRLILGLRLSDRTMRHRKYKVAHLPASLKPTVAAALVWLSMPSRGDVFLDPMAGAGTILIERAEAGPYSQLYGGDIRDEAVAVMAENIGTKYQPIDFRQWDATQLPLQNSSVSKIVCNLPFGKQIGTHESNVALYLQAFSEFNRVLKPEGLMVLLTTEDKLVTNGVASNPGLSLLKKYSRVTVLGLEATVYVIKKKGGG